MGARARPDLRTPIRAITSTNRESLGNCTILLLVAVSRETSLNVQKRNILYTYLPDVKEILIFLFEVLLLQSELRDVLTIEFEIYNPPR